MSWPTMRRDSDPLITALVNGRHMHIDTERGQDIHLQAGQRLYGRTVSPIGENGQTAPRCQAT